MSLSVGLDFGTSNSSVAVFDGEKLGLVPLEPRAPEPTVLRSLLYLSKGGDRFVGQEAFERHQAENVGRAVRLERRYVGDVSMTFGGVGTITTEAYAVVDANEPGRLFQSIKTLLPDRMFMKTNVFGVELTAEDLVVLLAGEILRRTEAHLGERVTRLTVGRPVAFSTNSDDNTLARGRLREAFGRLGIAEFGFMEEPVAAGISFAHHESGASPDGIFVVFDFGGGTLDITVVRGAGQAATVLSTGGVPVGGDLLDRRIVEARLLQHFGESATYGPTHLPVPRHILARLLDWQTLYLLNRPEPLGLIETMLRATQKRRELGNLKTLVTQGYGAALYRATEDAKQRLSSAGHATVELERPNLRVREILTREDFEGIIRDQHATVERCVAQTVERAGVRAEEVTVVVATGGSSRIPLFQRSLRKRFNNARLIEQNAFTSVAMGLALYGGGR